MMKVLLLSRRGGKYTQNISSRCRDQTENIKVIKENPHTGYSLYFKIIRDLCQAFISKNMEREKKKYIYIMIDR